MLWAMAKNKILQKALAKLSAENTLQELVDNLSMGQLTTLLLSVFSERAMKYRAHELVKLFEDNRFVKPSSLCPIKLRKVELTIFELAKKHAFDCVELSPVAPFGSTSAFGQVSQNNVLTALRSCEVLSDPSNMLALLLLYRWLKDKEKEALRLCASHQVVRTQFFDHPGSTSHFRLFSSCSLIKTKEAPVIANEVLRHLLFVKDVVKKLAIAGSRSTLHIKRKGSHLALALVDEAKRQGLDLQQAAAKEEDEGSYYYGLRIITDFERKDGWVNVGDCGLVDWASQIASQKDLVLVTNGLGLDRLLRAMQQ